MEPLTPPEPELDDTLTDWPDSASPELEPDADEHPSESKIPETIHLDSDHPTHSGVTFEEMNLIRPLRDAINHAGYKYATPVQAAVIPEAMKGIDVIGQAQTGTGKTCAFLVPLMNRWRPHNTKGPVALVM